MYARSDFLGQPLHTGMQTCCPYLKFMRCLQTQSSEVCACQARVIVYHSGSPRVFSPEAAMWWDGQMGANSSYRVVNNMDIVPSMPKRYITGNYG